MDNEVALQEKRKEAERRMEQRLKELQKMQIEQAKQEL